MTEKLFVSQIGGRLLFLDNLRSLVIVLVVSMHAADTYSPLGNWYFVDRAPLNRAELLFFAAWQMYLQSFFMGLLFFIAGYFVPASLARKGPGRFIRDRLFRLGLPVLFYMFVLGPVTEYFFAHSWTSTGPTSFANEWLKHIRNGQFLSENGPLWFCLALLIFTLVYTVFSRRTEGAVRRVPGTNQLIGFALLMWVCTFFVRLVFPHGFVFFNMHLTDFPQYVLLFSAGIVAAHGCWLRQLTARSAREWMGFVLPAGLAGWLLLLAEGGALRGQTSAYGGGWHWQAACLAIWESFTCVAICLGLLVLFRDKLDHQGRLARFLSDNAFSVYVFHPPIVILCARLLHALAWPAIPKFTLLSAAAASITFVLSAAVFRQMPLLRRIL